MQVSDGAIVLRPVKSNSHAGWDDLFRKAVEDGHTPDKDLFEDMSNDFDQDEWQ